MPDDLNIKPQNPVDAMQEPTPPQPVSMTAVSMPAAKHADAAADLPVPAAPEETLIAPAPEQPVIAALPETVGKTAAKTAGVKKADAKTRDAKTPEAKSSGASAAERAIVENAPVLDQMSGSKADAKASRKDDISAITAIVRPMPAGYVEVTKDKDADDIDSPPHRRARGALEGAARRRRSSCSRT